MSTDTNDPGQDGPGAPQVEVTPAEDARGGRPERADLGEDPDRAAHEDQDRMPDPTAAVASGGDVQGGTPPPRAPGDGDADGPERQP